MSVYGVPKAATISANGTTTSAIDLGREYDHLSMQIPPMDACKLYLQVSETLGGTYYDLDKDAMTEEETFNRADVFRLGGWRYIKVVASKPQTAQRLIRVFGMRY